MDPPIIDVKRVLVFGREKLVRKQMTFAAVAAVVGVAGVLFSDDDQMLTIVSWVLIAFGVGWGGYELSKVTQPQKPLLVLSPKGVGMRVEGATEFLIPWTEVRGVDAITVTGPRDAVFENVTVVLVDRAFYERVIHVDSFIRRGPGWDAIFIPRDGLMQVALHHEILPIDGPDLLAAVEARYRAFANPTAPAAA
jgi:hypothetical protein